MSQTCSCSQADDGRKRCTNISCKNYDEFQNILETCLHKEIAGVANVPSVRSCPNCREAIEHVEACNNMECRNCKKHFCFICLEPANAGGSLQCKAPHMVAPVQKLF